MKRLWIMILVACLLLSIGGTSALANNNFTNNDKLNETILENIGSPLSDSQHLKIPKTKMIVEGNTIEPKKQSIDFSKAVIHSTAKLKTSAPTLGQSSKGNNAPVADCLLITLNPETLVDNRFTTETQLFLAYVWDGVPYTYDVDGDPLDIYINGIPMAYMTPMVSDDSGYSYQGALIQFANPGIYDMEYFAVDPSGAKSNVVNASFDVTYPEAYKTFDGELSFAQDIKDYNIQVDFSVTPDFAVGVSRTGDGSIDVTVKDETGAVVGSAMKTSKGTHSQVGRAHILLPKPANLTIVKNYTITVSTPKFVEGDTRYHIVAGQKALLPTMLSDKTNMVKLDRFYNYPQNQGRPGNVYNENLLPNANGHWFKVTGTGNDTITLMTRATNNLRFKIMDTEHFVLFDSNTSPGAKRYTFIDGYGLQYNVNKASNLALDKNTDYYLAVYSLDGSRPAQSNDYYSIFCGEPYLESFMIDFSLSDINMVKGQQYTIPLNIQSIPNTSQYINMLNVRYASSADRNLIGDYFELQFPKDYIWRSVNTITGFTTENDDNKKITAEGTTKIKLTARNTGVFRANSIRLYLLCEV